MTKDSEVCARIIGVHSFMTKFEYLFDVVLGECILKHTDNRSKTLQNTSFGASEGQSIAEPIKHQGWIWRGDVQGVRTPLFILEM